MLTRLPSSLSYALIRFSSVSAHRLGRAERGNIVLTCGCSDHRWIPANCFGSLTRSTATRTLTRRSSSRASKRPWSPPPRSITAKRRTSQIIIDRTRRVDRRHAQRRAPGAGGNGRADRRPDRQAGDDPEDSRGRTRRPVSTNTRNSRGSWSPASIQRYEGGAATVALANVEAILPRGEQIPGETHHANERVRATVYEVRKAGSRVKIILSRTKPQLVAAALRAGNPRNRRRRDRNPLHRPRARLSHQGRRQQHRPARGLRRGLRGRPRQPHQEHRR